MLSPPRITDPVSDSTDAQDVESYLSGLLSAIDRQLEEFLPARFKEADVERLAGAATWSYHPGSLTEMISVPVWDLLVRPASRWRPLFGVAMLESLGRSAEPFMALLSALAELSHTGSLIVDDIQDGSDTRRGDRSVHLKYGVPTALNAANALYFLPQILLIDHPELTDAQKLEIHELISRQFVRAHVGQTMDLYWSKEVRRNGILDDQGERLREHVLQMYALKSATIAVTVAETASVITRPGDDVRKACVRFGEAVGVAFQIMDDIKDYARVDGRLKPLGADLSEGKVTLVLLNAMADLGPVDQRRLVELASSLPGNGRAEDLDEALDLVAGTAAFDSCREEASAIYRSARNEFVRQVPESTPRSALLHLCDKLAVD